MKYIFKLLITFGFFTNSLLFSMTHNKENNNPYQHLKMKNGYQAILSSDKPLTNGKNNIKIVILKNNTFVQNADVNIIFALPTINNMEFSGHALEKNDRYSLNVNFKQKGEWEYELMFKTNYGAIYSKEGRVTIN